MHNTKAIPLTQEQLKIIDQVPVTADQRIVVKILNPPLASPCSNDSGFNLGPSIRDPVNVGEGIVAQWEGVDELEADEDKSANGRARMLGKEGKFYWLCTVPSMGKVDLKLEWEVVVPAGGGYIEGLGVFSGVE